MARDGFDTLDGQLAFGGRPEGQVLSGRSSNRHKQTPRHTNSSLGFRVAVAGPLN